MTNEKQARKEADRSRRLDTFSSSRIFLLSFFFFFLSTSREFLVRWTARFLDIVFFSLERLDLRFIFGIVGFLQFESLSFERKILIASNVVFEEIFVVDIFQSNYY